MISCLIADQIDFDRATYEIAIAGVFQLRCKPSTLDRLNRVPHRVKLFPCRQSPEVHCVIRRASFADWKLMRRFPYISLTIDAFTSKVRLGT